MSQHIPRADRPSRDRAIKALVAYLEHARDIRIGQAIVNASGAVDAFNIEDDELASTLEQATPARPASAEDDAGDLGPFGRRLCSSDASPDANRGLYSKYRIERTNGSSGPGGKHENCEYFVLDLVHDKYAFDALKAYATACREEFPALASDLLRRMAGERTDELARTENARRGTGEASLSDEVLRMVHAFTDEGRRQAVRDLAARVSRLELRSEAASPVHPDAYEMRGFGSDGTPWGPRSAEDQAEQESPNFTPRDLKEFEARGWTRINNPRRESPRPQHCDDPKHDDPCTNAAAHKASPAEWSAARIFDEVGNACASVEAEQDAPGPTSAGICEGARRCLRRITALRTQALATPMPGVAGPEKKGGAT